MFLDFRSNIDRWPRKTKIAGLFLLCCRKAKLLVCLSPRSFITPEFVVKTPISRFARHRKIGKWLWQLLPEILKVYGSSEPVHGRFSRSSEMQYGDSGGVSFVPVSIPTYSGFNRGNSDSPSPRLSRTKMKWQPDRWPSSPTRTYPSEMTSSDDSRNKSNKSKQRLTPCMGSGYSSHKVYVS